MKDKFKGLILTIVIIAMLAFLYLFINNSNDFKQKKEPEVKEIDGVEITLTEASKVQMEEYNNSLISVKIPKGFKVETMGDSNHYMIRIYNKENPLYQIFISLKLDGFSKSNEVKALWNQLYGSTSMFALMPVLTSQTAEGFYNIFPQVAAANESNIFNWPEINNFSRIESYGKGAFGGEILRALFKNNDGDFGQGLFTATVTDIGSYYVNGIDTYPLYVYNAILLTAPESEFMMWQEPLIKCLSTLKYSDKFIADLDNEDKAFNYIKNNDNVYSEISKSMNDAWLNRNSTYDVVSEKSSDATLGYDRVVNIETLETYRAKKVFLENYKGDKYKLVDDDTLYSKPISGYIYE